MTVVLVPEQEPVVRTIPAHKIILYEIVETADGLAYLEAHVPAGDDHRVLRLTADHPSDLVLEILGELTRIVSRRSSGTVALGALVDRITEHRQRQEQ